MKFCLIIYNNNNNLFTIATEINKEQFTITKNYSDKVIGHITEWMNKDKLCSVKPVHIELLQRAHRTIKTPSVETPKPKNGLP